MRHMLLSRNTVRISVLAASCLLIAVAAIFRHGATLCMGDSMKFVTGKELLFWAAVVLLSIVALVIAWAIWRR
jgi:hypothetical protein